MKTIEKVDIAARLSELIIQKYEQLGIYLVDAHVQGRRIEVVCDSDSGLTIDDCAEITRYLQFHIDHEDLYEANYILEISSPGLDRPLKLPRQYRKNVGRTISVKSGEAKHEGALVMVDSFGIMIKPKHEGNKKEPQKPLMRFLWNEIQSTRVLALTK
jgi:ribosome maturation factor RimP